MDFSPHLRPYTEAAWLAPMLDTPAGYAHDVFAVHLRHLTAHLGPSRLGPYGVEFRLDDDNGLGAWIAVPADDLRLFLFQTTFTVPDGAFGWGDPVRAVGASRAFAQTVEHFGGEEIENNAPTDGTWERILQNLGQKHRLAPISPSQAGHG